MTSPTRPSTQAYDTHAASGFDPFASAFGVFGETPPQLVPALASRSGEEEAAAPAAAPAAGADAWALAFGPPPTDGDQKVAQEVAPSAALQDPFASAFGL